MQLSDGDKDQKETRPFSVLSTGLFHSHLLEDETPDIGVFLDVFGKR